MSVLKLVIDRQSKKLVSVGGSIVQLPRMFQSNAQQLQIYVVEPTGGINPAYTILDLATYGCRVSIGDTPTGSSGGPSPLTLQDTFVWNTTLKCFEASLAMNVVAIDTFIGSAASKSAYFEVNLTISGTRETILQEACTLAAVVDELTSTTPTPTDQYLTKAECLALFAKYVNDAGKTIVFTSPDGTKKREIGENDDGTGLDDQL